MDIHTVNNSGYGFRHYLITRFNLKQSEWAGNKYYNPREVVVENCLKERFELFENYCFPSVFAKKDKSFKWLVYFDVDAPLFYREVIIHLIRLLNGYEMLRNLNRTLTKQVPESIQSLV